MWVPIRFWWCSCILSLDFLEQFYAVSGFTISSISTAAWLQSLKSKRRVKNYWQLKLNPKVHSKIASGFTQDIGSEYLSSSGWDSHLVHENWSRAVLLSLKEMLRCGYSCPAASRLCSGWTELRWPSLSGLYFSFDSQFHSTMLNGVRMRALRKICPLTVRNHWSDGKIPSLSA